MYMCMAIAIDKKNICISISGQCYLASHTINYSVIALHIVNTYKVD